MGTQDTHLNIIFKTAIYGVLLFVPCVIFYTGIANIHNYIFFRKDGDLNLTYEEFKINLTAEVTNIAGEEVDVTVHKVEKNNGIVLDAISVMEKGVCVTPSIYLQDLYEACEGGESMSTLAKKVIRLSEEGRLSVSLPDDFFMDFEKIKDRVCYRLINYEKNRKMLNHIPHLKVMDLALVFYYSIKPQLLKNASVLIKNSDMLRWRISQKDLEMCAEKNTPRIHECQLFTMAELMRQIMDTRKLNCSLNFEEFMMQMYILTNREKYFGAACILYPNVLEQIAEQLNSHFYILPSSIHECIIIPASGCFSREFLNNVVTEVNESELDEVEVLSDHAYYYDRDRKKIIL